MKTNFLLSSFLQDFNKKLLNPETHFGMDLSNAEHHAIITKIYKEIIKSAEKVVVEHYMGVDNEKK